MAARWKAATQPSRETQRPPAAQTPSPDKNDLGWVTGPLAWRHARRLLRRPQYGCRCCCCSVLLFPPWASFQGKAAGPPQPFGVCLPCDLPASACRNVSAGSGSGLDFTGTPAPCAAVCLGNEPIQPVQCPLGLPFVLW